MMFVNADMVAIVASYGEKTTTVIVKNNQSSINKGKFCKFSPQYRLAMSNIKLSVIGSY